MGRVFAATDFHGMGKLVNKIFNFLQEDDKLIFCGDAIDRGPNSLEITLKLKNDPRCIYLKGNHENMAAAAIKSILTDKIDNSLCLWESNGGRITFEQIKSTNLSLFEWYDYFSKLPLRYTYRNKNNQIIICDHAGFTPGQIAEPLWDRKHFDQKWPTDTPVYENLYVVHGHTPIHFLGTDFSYINESGKLKRRNHTNPDKVSAYILKYCNGHKINLDLCSVVTKKIALLNLDTFEETYFSEEG